jgi:hypothetical protein
LPEQTDGWWGQARSRFATKTAGVLAVFGGGATAIGVSGKLADTPETLFVLSGIWCISQALTILGLALLDRIETKRQQILWDSQDVRLILDLVKEVKPGGKLTTPFFVLDNTSAASAESPAAKEPPSDPPLAAAQ